MKNSKCGCCQDVLDMLGQVQFSEAERKTIVDEATRQLRERGWCYVYDDKTETGQLMRVN